MVIFREELVNIWYIAVAVVLVTLILVTSVCDRYSIFLENVVNKRRNPFVGVIINYIYFKVSRKIDAWLLVFWKLWKVLLIEFNKAYTSDEGHLLSGAIQVSNLCSRKHIILKENFGSERTIINLWKFLFALLCCSVEWRSDLCLWDLDYLKFHFDKKS